MEHTEHQRALYSGTRLEQVFSVPPALNADDLRISVLAKLKRYSELQMLDENEGVHQRATERSPLFSMLSLRNSLTAPSETELP